MGYFENRNFPSGDEALNSASAEADLGGELVFVEESFVGRFCRGFQSHIHATLHKPSEQSRTMHFGDVREISGKR